MKATVASVLALFLAWQRDANNSNDLRMAYENARRLTLAPDQRDALDELVVEFYWREEQRDRAARKAAGRPRRCSMGCSSDSVDGSPDHGLYTCAQHAYAFWTEICESYRAPVSA